MDRNSKYMVNGIPTVHQVRRYKMVSELAETCSGKALDYGCGYGDVTYRLSPKFDCIIGVDPQLERVNWAKREYPSLQFMPCGKCGVDFSDHSFDTVISTMVINWVDDPSNHVAEVARLLKPGGKLIISSRAPDRLDKLLSHLRKKPWSEEHNRNHSIVELCSLLKTNGFQIEEIKCYWDSIEETRLGWKRICIEMMYATARLNKNCSFAPYFGVRAQLKNHLNQLNQ